MRSPAFWWTASSPMATMLAPFGWIYGEIAGWRMARAGTRASIPVICVGNLVAGGAGKTPTAIAIAGLLRAMNRRPVFLTRGYGGRIREPTLVDPLVHGADETGDEPLLLAAHAPTIVSPDRVAGAKLAAAHGDVIVMDDGLQNPSLAKDLRIAVVDAGAGIGNGLCIPAGPLRAPLSVQDKFIDMVLLVGIGAAPAGLSAPVMRARLMPDPVASSRLTGRSVLAFAGIGRPEKFFETLREAGAILGKTAGFPDHHPYEPATIRTLLAEADGLGLIVVTTEKDRVRLKDVLDTADLARIDVLPVAMEFEVQTEIIGMLQSAVMPKH